MDIKHAPTLDNTNYKLKAVDEDFIVEELVKYDMNDSGQFMVFKLIKSGLNTIDAIRKISDKLKINFKDIGYAGLKDRNAVTIQYISIPKYCDVAEDNDFSTENNMLQLVKVGYRNERIYPGCLSSNKFTIVVRNLEDSQLTNYIESGKLPEYYINFFGEQRFSKNNHLIGKCMIKKDYVQALNLITETLPSRDKDRLELEMKNCNGNYLQAFLSVDKKLLRLYLHAYQSELWNKSAFKYLELKEVKSLSDLESMKDVYIPMVGFDIEAEGDIMKIVRDIMIEESVTSMDFILRQFQGMGLEGGNRSLINVAGENDIIDVSPDEFNSGKNKLVIKFILSKGSYATEYVRQLFL